MISSAIELLRERGAACVTVQAVLSRSGTPRGSVYHHFPDGRGQLITDALTTAGDAMAAYLEGATEDGALQALRKFGRAWDESLTSSGFRAGCPLLSVAIGGSEEDDHLHPAVTEVFARWRRALTDAMVADGVEQVRAERLAVTAVSAVEGAVALCRLEESTEPLDSVVAELEVLLKGALPDERPR